ncbi:hypothetical protein ANCCAN_13566 [Ancylostoma caninum]|uniref:Uncharacterized protein n=1 Tax=Ancylostoma caninum TaxID=29170 RepID=A0A368G9Y4_ANCCA|nr:hypothetical protein ANCCAN_13566 [Ancylostoma caninum]
MNCRRRLHFLGTAYSSHNNRKHTCDLCARSRGITTEMLTAPLEKSGRVRRPSLGRKAKVTVTRVRQFFDLLKLQMGESCQGTLFNSPAVLTSLACGVSRVTVTRTSMELSRLSYSNGKGMSTLKKYDQEWTAVVRSFVSTMLEEEGLVALTDLHSRLSFAYADFPMEDGDQIYIVPDNKSDTESEYESEEEDEDVRLLTYFQGLTGYLVQVPNHDFLTGVFGGESSTTTCIRSNLSVVVTCEEMDAICCRIFVDERFDTIMSQDAATASKPKDFSSIARWLLLNNEVQSNSSKVCYGEIQPCSTKLCCGENQSNPSESTTARRLVSNRDIQLNASKVCSEEIQPTSTKFCCGENQSNLSKVCYIHLLVVREDV